MGLLLPNVAHGAKQCSGFAITDVSGMSPRR